LQPGQIGSQKGRQHWMMIQLVVRLFAGLAQTLVQGQL
jgi:hypothetical protein